MRALGAGVDVDNPNGASFLSLVDAVKAKRVTMKQIDDATRRFLTVKFQSGTFDHPYSDVAAADALTGNADAKARALEAAHKSVVLLKNDGLLPLKAGSGETIAVIGPNANFAHLGGYASIIHTHGQRPRRHQGEARPNAKILYAEGDRITDSNEWSADEVKLADPAENAKRIQEAVKVAKKADKIILVLGDTEQTSREAWADNHMGDRDSLDLVGQQDDLANAIFALKKPVVVVLINGRPLSVVNVSDKANALVEGWYLGPRGRHGDGRRPLRRLQPRRTLAGDDPALCRPTADVLQLQALGAPRLSLRQREAALSVRLGPQLHDLRRRRAEAFVIDHQARRNGRCRDRRQEHGQQAPATKSCSSTSTSR